MAGRRLAPDEAELWGRVRASVRPIHAPKPIETGGATLSGARKVRATVAATPVSAQTLPARSGPGITLDAGWDRRLARGAVSPDSVVDLHDHTLASAHAMLDAAIGQAIARGDRLMLVVTGKPPRAGSERPHARGAIRAQIADWLALSRHAGNIASVRNAHPRHGGGGALYLILRRPRTKP